MALRAADSALFRGCGKPGIMWASRLSSASSSRVIYGLRAEVRQARASGSTAEQKLGEGEWARSTGAARHVRRPSAVKLLRSDGRASSTSVASSAKCSDRALDPPIPSRFRYGRTHDGVFYYADELLDARPLQRIVAVDGRSASRVLRILNMVCGALPEDHTIA